MLRPPARHIDAHRHFGVLPAFPFYGGPPVNPDAKARDSVADLIADMDAEGTERALIIPNYGVPDPTHSFALNERVVEAAANNDRLSCALWASPRPQDDEHTDRALALAGEAPVKALKISFLLGGSVEDEGCLAQLDKVFSAAKEHGLVVHVHTSPGAASDIDKVGVLVERYADEVPLHLVHFGGGVSGHIKLVGGRFFDWIESGKKVYTDLTWAVGFAPNWLAREIDRRGIGADRVLFATDQPWGDFGGEYYRMIEAAGGDTELGGLIFHDNFEKVYG